MAFEKTFDELLDAILTDWRNQFPGADTSRGSLIFIKSACLASALWGVYKYQQWIARQIFPDTADTAYLDHHGWVRGMARTYGESDADYLARILYDIRNPSGGGTRYDYVRWATEVDGVAGAWCIPLGQGIGTVDVVIAADADVTGSEVPSDHTGVGGTATATTGGKLVDAAATFATDGVAVGDIVTNDDTDESTTVSAVDSETALSLAADIFPATGQAYSVASLTATVKAHIDGERPVTVKELRVLAPAVVATDVTMTVSGAGLAAGIAAAIEAHMAALEPGQALTLASLYALAINAGATDATIIAPAASVTATAYQIIRAGAIDVTEA